LVISRCVVALCWDGPLSTRSVLSFTQSRPFLVCSMPSRCCFTKGECIGCRAGRLGTIYSRRVVTFCPDQPSSTRSSSFLPNRARFGPAPLPSRCRYQSLSQKVSVLGDGGLFGDIFSRSVVTFRPDRPSSTRSITFLPTRARFRTVP
jgi:hypothetical protein